MTWTGSLDVGMPVTITCSASITDTWNSAPIANYVTINDGLNSPFNTVPVTVTAAIFRVYLPVTASQFSAGW
jgi:hypothetical protein